MASERHLWFSDSDGDEGARYLALHRAYEGVVRLVEAPTTERCHYSSGALRLLAKALGGARSVRLRAETTDRDIVKEELWKLRKSALTEGLDITPWRGNARCTVFLFWCLERRRTGKADERDRR